MQVDCLEIVIERGRRELERGTNNTVDRLFSVLKTVIDDVKQVVRNMSCGRPSDVDSRHRTERRRVPSPPPSSRPSESTQRRSSMGGGSSARLPRRDSTLLPSSSRRYPGLMPSSSRRDPRLMPSSSRRDPTPVPPSSQRHEEDIPESTDVQPGTAADVIPDSPLQAHTVGQFPMGDTAPWYESGYTMYPAAFTPQGEPYHEQFTQSIPQPEPSWCPSTDPTTDPNAWVTDLFSTPVLQVLPPVYADTAVEEPWYDLWQNPRSPDRLTFPQEQIRQRPMAGTRRGRPVQGTMAESSGEQREQ